MLRFARFSQFDGAQFWIVLFFVAAIWSEIIWYILQFDKRQSIQSSGKFCSFRNAICKVLILNPEKQTEALVREASDWKWREHLHINWLSFCLKVVKTPATAWFYSLLLIEYSTVTFEFDPYALLSTGYRKRTKTIHFGACSGIKTWLLNWYHFNLLIFIKLNVNMEYELSGYFLFAQYMWSSDNTCFFLF